MQALLIDLDGVVYVEDSPLPGAIEALAWLRELRIPHLFVTNTSSRSRGALVQKLAWMGIQIASEQLVTPPVIASQWLRKEAPGPAALFVPDSARVDFAGVPLLPDDAESGAASVVIGHLGRRWDYTKLNRAFRLLMAEPRPVLVALGMTRYARTATGLDLIVAPFVVALEHAADCTAVVLGKPSPIFFASAVAMLGHEPTSVAMIGDDIVTDIAGAQNAGLRGILVKTGKFRSSDLNRSIQPDGILTSIAELPDWWGSMSSR